MAAEIEAETEKLQQIFSNPAPPLPLPVQQAAPKPRVSAPRPRQPVAPTPNWSAAKAEFRVGGTVSEKGEIFALINGSLHRHGDTVQTSQGPFTYYFRVNIQDKSAEITPVRSVRK